MTSRKAIGDSKPKSFFSGTLTKDHIERAEGLFNYRAKIGLYFYKLELSQQTGYFTLDVSYESKLHLYRAADIEMNRFDSFAFIKKITDSPVELNNLIESERVYVDKYMSNDIKSKLKQI